jgi:toxin ParE1/3/4
VSYQFHPEAEAEHLEAVAYYENRHPGLGTSYLAEFEFALEQVCEAPHRYPIERQPDIRRIRLRRFPFTVLFRESEGTVQVLAVAHHRRRPLYWLSRL